MLTIKNREQWITNEYKKKHDKKRTKEICDSMWAPKVICINFDKLYKFEIIFLLKKIKIKNKIYNFFHRSD